MTENSPNLTLPYLAPGQAQKHVTVNQSFQRLDAIVQMSVASATVAVQPGAPADGDVHILPAGKSGVDWGAMANASLAYYRDGAWEQLTPREGWLAYVRDIDRIYVYAGASWLQCAAPGGRQMIFTPGGDGVTSIYRIDTTRVQNPRTATISSVVSDVITITTADAGLFFESARMTGVCYLRIWNTSKTPNQSAWVKAQPASNTLQVVSAAAISTWTAAETIQIGDPTSVTPNRYVALDISPMMQAVLGSVFPQAGVLTKVLAQGVGALASAGISDTGDVGSNQTTKCTVAGEVFIAQQIIPCSVLSPISNSNLVFVQEVATGTTMGIAGVTVLGVFV